MSITSIHEKVLDYIIDLRADDSSLYFAPRKTNKKNRLSDGYWFLGNDNYVNISFWNGLDWKQKINNIGFVIYRDKSCAIELSAQDSPAKAAFLQKVAARLKGFKRQGNKNKWHKHLRGRDYIKLLDNFLRKDKPIINQLLSQANSLNIVQLNKDYDQKYGEKVIRLRQQQIHLGKTRKITRIVWNTESWRRPSGPLGKSLSSTAYEFMNGFGNEEWIFDRTKIIEGYHYGFLQSLNLKSDRHAGKIYVVTLYAINNDKKRYVIGTIDNLECISAKVSARIHSVYKQNGWIGEMANDLQNVGVNPKPLFKTPPETFFNMRFRFSDLSLNEELQEIADGDGNITTVRFKLLPLKTSLQYKLIDIDGNSRIDEDDSDEGNRKKTDTRKKAYQVNCEFDPYHDKMQNALFDRLKNATEYEVVKIEKTRVDIKARTLKGEWHYFEIKTDSPKLSIRKALGQVMEYAYYPAKLRASKLIIIGDTEPSQEIIQYLQFIRKQFTIPVFYRSLDISTNTLSQEY